MSTPSRRPAPLTQLDHMQCATSLGIHLMTALCYKMSIFFVKIIYNLSSAATVTINQLQAVEEDDYDDTDHPFNEDPTPEDFHQGRE